MKNYDPRAIINNIRRKINGESYEVMHPFYNGFTGDIIADQSKVGNYTCTGKIQRIDETTLEITELPLKVWTQDYKEFLEKMASRVAFTCAPPLKMFKKLQGTCVEKCSCAQSLALKASYAVAFTSSKSLIN